MSHWKVLKIYLYIATGLLLINTLSVHGKSILKQYRPIVLWHGMGDSCCNKNSMGQVMEFIKEKLPGIYVRSIALNADDTNDRRASFFGSINEQVADVYQQLGKDEKLAGGFNAIGFSQGGQFLRAYVQRYNKPRVYNLVTFGSQHSGVADVPNCVDNTDLWCKMMRGIVRRNAYTEWAQQNIIQAQYYKDPENLEAYSKTNHFLTDINNEGHGKNETYADHMASLSRLILIKLEEDTMVVPKESSWFGYYNGSDKSVVLPLRELPIYTEDWIGLQILDKSGRIILKETPGPHMHISLQYLDEEILQPYLSDPVYDPKLIFQGP